MNETICALATATGGALGIIRISGPRALEILSHVFTKDLTTAHPNTIHYGHIIHHPLPSSEDDRPGVEEIIDEVMVSVFRAPHSYTGEDSAEITCHGSRYILNKVLELLIQNGCRMAQPGEYTQRAFLNGKMDLSQAEAVADLIASNNKATHQIAMSQLRGNFSSELARLRKELLKLTSLLELELDFSDHEDLEFADRSELYNLALSIEVTITHLARTFKSGQAIKEGIPVAIVGKTNVGKSTLLNRLIHEDRAIVSDIHGTTRDTVEDTIELHGATFRFIDTAGIRSTNDQVEQIGIERSYAAIEKSRIVIWLIDEQPTSEEIQDMLINRCGDKAIIIALNKIDKENKPQIEIPPLIRLGDYTFIKISAKENLNINGLEDAICEVADIPYLNDSAIVVSNARHYDALIRAHKSISRVIEGLQQQISGDLLSEDLRQTLDILAEITGGQITPQETLNNIFKHFCVGK